MISAVYSRFSGVLSGGSVWTETHMFKCKEPTFSSEIERVDELCPHQQEVVVFRFCPQILEDDLLHEPLHQVPVLNDAVTDRPLDRNAKRTSASLKWGKTTSHRNLYLCCVRRFVNGFVPDEEVQIIDTPHHPALGLIANLGWFFDGDTWWWCKHVTEWFMFSTKKMFYPKQGE